VLDSIAPHRRLALHRAALTALEDLGEPAELAHLAEHAEAAGDRDAVLRWAPRAAHQAALSGSHREAAAHYGRALAYADHLRPAELETLLRGRVQECWMTDQFDAAIVAQQRLLEGRRPVGDLAGEGDATRVLSRLMFFAAGVAEGEALAGQAVELLETLPPGHELAMAYGNLAQRRTVLDDTAATRH
jgi:hypothetical protein